MYYEPSEFKPPVFHHFMYTSTHPTAKDNIWNITYTNYNIKPKKVREKKGGEMYSVRKKEREKKNRKKTAQQQSMNECCADSYLSLIF